MFKKKKLRNLAETTAGMEYSAFCVIECGKNIVEIEKYKCYRQIKREKKNV